MEPTPPAPRRLADFFVLRRSMVGMLLMAVLVSMGEKLGDRFLPVYLQLLGGGALAIGLLGGAKNLLSAVYSYPGGWLAHRLGYKHALLVFNLMSIAGYAIVIAVPSWPAVIAGALLFLSWSAVSLPATMELIAHVVPKNKRAMGVSLHSLVRRVPMALGPLVGGWLIDRYGVSSGIRIGFAIATGVAVVAMFVQQVLITDQRGDSARSDEPGAGRATTAPPPAGWRARWRAAFPALSPALRELLTSDILIRFCEQIPDAFVVIWCTETIARPVSATQFGVLTTVEMATAALCYVPVAHYADRFGKRPFVLTTFVFFTLFPLTLLFSHSFWPLVAVFVVRGLKEFGDATRKALILDLAPEGQKAQTFGIYYSLRDTIVAFAAFGGAYLWSKGPTTALLTAFACGAAGTVWFALFGRDVERVTK